MPPQWNLLRRLFSQSQRDRSCCLLAQDVLDDAVELCDALFRCQSLVGIVRPARLNHRFQSRRALRFNLAIQVNLGKMYMLGNINFYLNNCTGVATCFNCTHVEQHAFDFDIKQGCRSILAVPNGDSAEVYSHPWCAPAHHREPGAV